MKKRVILMTSLLVLIVLVLLYTISLIVLGNENRSKAREEIKIYLNVAEDFYDDSLKNYADTAGKMVSLDDRLRVTFIDIDGNVLYDSVLEYNISDFDNHLNREEIRNLGEVVIRESDNLDKKMMYIATLEGNTYIRLSFDSAYFATSTIMYAVIGIFAIIAITSVAVIVLFIVSKKMLKPINSKINELALIADADIVFKTDNIDQLPEIITALKLLIANKIKLIKEESMKNETIIQAIDESLILLKDDNVILINNQALKLFMVNEESVIDKNYIYLIRNNDLLEAIKEVKNTKLKKHLTINIENRVYDVNLIPFNSLHILISLKDMTEREKIEVIKKDFFANASHELKSPLTSIIGYEQMILNGIIEDKDEIKEASINILKEATRMNQIIIDMLELSNLEFSKTYELVDINLKDMINNIIERYNTRIKDKKIKLKLELKDKTIKANKEQIETLLSNIIDNAIKYNKEKGTIEIKLAKDLIVKDTGIGIPKEDISRVFERFYRVDKAKSKETGGTGLGLAIVKHICEKFGYKVELDSTLNIGTEVKIIF